MPTRTMHQISWEYPIKDLLGITLSLVFSYIAIGSLNCKYIPLSWNLSEFLGGIVLSIVLFEIDKYTKDFLESLLLSSQGQPEKSNEEETEYEIYQIKEMIEAKRDAKNFSPINSAVFINNILSATLGCLNQICLFWLIEGVLMAHTFVTLNHYFLNHPLLNFITTFAAFWFFIFIFTLFNNSLLVELDQEMRFSRRSLLLVNLGIIKEIKANFYKNECFWLNTLNPLIQRTIVTMSLIATRNLLIPIMLVANSYLYPWLLNTIVILILSKKRNKNN